MKNDFKNSQIGGDESCPCGSGLKYRECCADSATGKWIRNEDGSTSLQVQLSPESVTALEGIIKEREKNLGHPLEDDDMLFGDIDPKKFINTFIRVTFSSGIDMHPVYLYIFLVEGLILSSENIPRITTGDRILILDAVSTYAHSDDRASLLEPYRETLDSDLYILLEKLFRDDDDDKDEILLPYIKMLVNDSVREAVYRYQGPDRSDKPGRSDKSGRTGRNDPCPCGSGKKYKKCCGSDQ